MSFEQSGSVGADSEDRGVGENQLPCVTHNDVQAHGDDDVDQHQIPEIDVVGVGSRQGQRQQQAIRSVPAMNGGVILVTTPVSGSMFRTNRWEERAVPGRPE